MAIKVRSGNQWLNLSSGGGGGTFVLLSEKSATGTEVEFTGIPSDALEITVMFKGVSLNSDNDILVQLGYSNTWIASGYVSNSENTQGNERTFSANGFVIYSHTAAAELHGSMIINKASSSSYTEIGEFRRSNSGGAHARGSLSSVSDTETRLKVTILNQNNQDAFDAGTISVSYKTSGGGGGIGGVIVENNGTALPIIANTLNFTGDGVTASGNNTTKTINVNGKFTGLTDTPADYTGQANKFVRVNANADGLEFLTQTPTTGAAGNDKQVQYNDGSTLQGANGLEFIKWTSVAATPVAPSLVLKPSSDYTDNTGSNAYGGGNITTQTKLDGGNPSVPWNRATLTADGSLELMRRRAVDPTGGPYIDFKSQLGDGDPVGTGDGEDMDARIQMDYAHENGSINTSSADYSAITFQTGGKGYPLGTNTNGNVVERLRIGKNGEIGILAGAFLSGGATNTRTDDDKYGQSGYVLTSNGKGNSVSWTSKGTPSSSNFTTPLTVRLPATQPGTNLNDTVNMGEFNSNSSINEVKLLIYNKRVNASVSNNSWEGVATRIGRQIDSSNHAHIQFGSNYGDNNQDIHLNTRDSGDIEFQQAKKILLHANKIDFATSSTSQPDLNFSNLMGMTLVASSGALGSASGATDTGISVNQSWAGGTGLLFFNVHNDYGAGGVQSQVYLLRFAYAGAPNYSGTTPGKSLIKTSGSVPGSISLGTSSQNTLTISTSLDTNYGGRWHLLVGGSNCVDAFIEDV